MERDWTAGIDRAKSAAFQARALRALLVGWSLPAALPTAQGAPHLAASKTDSLVVPRDGDAAADAGDTLRYTVTITASGDANTDDAASGDTIDAKTTLVGVPRRRRPSLATVV
jgi:uncharacterized repeat protein (TIGR01451 family)